MRNTVADVVSLALDVSRRAWTMTDQGEKDWIKTIGVRDLVESFKDNLGAMDAALVALDLETNWLVRPGETDPDEYMVHLGAAALINRAAASIIDRKTRPTTATEHGDNK